jgi:hypothetical protein
VPIVKASHYFCNADKYKRLLKVKLHSFPVINHYANHDSEKYQKYAQQILNCSNELKLRILSEPTLEGIISQISIEEARWCRCRQCPMCQFARSSKYRAKLFKVFSQLDVPKNYSFLTLTQRNRPLNQLRDALSEMTEAWDKFAKRRTLPIVGWLRTTEVTRQLDRLPTDKGKNSGQPTRSPDGQLIAHPHFHVLCEMKEDYFESNFQDKAWWIQQWQSALRADYLPSISIKRIQSTSGNFAKALLETAKYSVKPEELSDSPEWLYGITEQLHGLRFLTVGGTFSKLFNQKELDKIEDSCSAYEEHSQVGQLLHFTWNDLKNTWDVFDGAEE